MNQRDPLPLSVIVLTLNEERHLPGCLESVRGLGRQLVVVDSGSTDRTVEIAQAAGAEVVTHRFVDFPSQRNAALALAREPWVLFVDADERVTPQLAEEIRAALAQGDERVAGFWIPTQNWMWGKWIRGGGWWPDEHLRLLRVGRARYRSEITVHEVVELDGEARHLASPLVHLNYDSRREFVRKQLSYARLAARSLVLQGRRPRRRTFLGQPLREFWRRFVTLRGYRDGLDGLFLATMMAFATLVTWILVVRLWRRRALRRSQRVTALAEPAALDVSVVIVSYRSRAHLPGCLDSVQQSLEASQLRGEVIVVDNASPDGSADLVATHYPWVRLVANSANRGFAAAANQGIQLARGRVIVLLNPDARLVGEALGRLVRFLDQHPTAGAVGPRLRYPDGRTQPSRRRFPTLLTGFLESTLVQDYWRDNRVLRRYYVADRSDDELQEVDWLVGACLAIRREALATVGLFDERFFLYSEEVEWFWRVRRAGWRVYYLPDAEVVHAEGGSSEPESAFRQIAFDTAKVQLFRSLYGPLAAEVLRAFLLLTYAVRFAREAAKWLVGHKRVLRWRRMARDWHAFRSLLRPRIVRMWAERG
ncbi:glycosyltransferase [Thermomicrobium sp. 4228-Ro]|uniref:glycosyltransferase n=1 Tax=Thermomicrobium sp. 4228-Ro TaxID=2993937 RepID=UPI0022488218|nr:glycosyltransferase [Thermomicrobium sp. 4228-Ro]MCX2727139.1 glycosyltransferase [Thermomicrobium sp. 4228-Ro]